MSTETPKPRRSRFWLLYGILTALALIEGQALAAREELLGRQGAGNDFLGWIDFPVA